MPATPAGPPSAPARPAAKPRRRWPRWLLWTCLTLLVLVAAAVIALQQPSIATFLANAGLSRIAGGSHVTFRAALVRAEGLNGFEIGDFRMTRGDTLLLGIDHLRIRYRLASLLTGRFRFQQVELEGGAWTSDLLRPPPPEERALPPRPALTLADLLRGRFYSGPALRVDRLSIRGAKFVAAPLDTGPSLGRVDLQAHDVRLGDAFSFVLDSLHAAGRLGARGPAELWLGATLDRGRLEAADLRFRSDSSAVDGSFLLALDRRDSLAESHLVVHARPLALGDLETILPGQRLGGAAALDIDVRGVRPGLWSGGVTLNAGALRWDRLTFERLHLGSRVNEGRYDTELSAVWGRANVQAKGWIRPFDPTPTYDVEASTDALMPGITGVAWWPPHPEKLSQSVAIHLRGSGFANAALEAQARSRGKAGDLDLDAGLDLRSGVAWNVRRFAFQRVDLARLLGDTTSSALNGTLGAVQSDPRGRNIVADLTLGPSHYGSWQLKQGQARATWKGDQLGASLRLEANAGSLEIQSMTARLASPAWIRLNEATFRDVNLASLTGQRALESRLDGTMRGELRGFSGLGDWQAALHQGSLVAQSQVQLDPSEFRGRKIDRGSAQLSLARGELRLQGNLSSPAGTLDLASHGRPFGRVPFYAVDRAGFANVDLGTWTQIPSLTSRWSGVLTAEARQPAASPPAWDWSSVLRLAPSSLGATRFQGGQATASWSGGRGHIEAALHVAADTLTARGDVTVRDGTSRGAGTLSLPFRVLAAMAGLDTLPATGRLVARTTFTLPAAGRAQIEGTIAGAGKIGDARLDSLLALFHLRQDVFTLDTLRAASNAGVARGAGQVVLSPGAGPRSDLRLMVALRDALPLRRVLRLDSLTTDSARFDVRLQGDGLERRLEADGSLRSMVWNETRLAGANFSLRSELDREWQPKRTHLEAQLERLETAGTVMSHGEGRWDLDGDDLAFDVGASHDPQHRIHVAGRSVGDSSRKVLSLAQLEIQSDSASWSLKQPAHLEIYPTRFVLEPFELRSTTGRISAGGVINRRGEQDFRLQMRDVGLDLLAGWVPRSNLTGTVNADFELAGPAAAPRGSGALEARLAGEGGPVGTLRSRFQGDGSRLQVGGAFITPPGDSLTWAGNLPLAWSLAEHPPGTSPMRVLEGKVEAHVAAQHFPLAALSPLFDPRSVGTLAGTLDVDAHLAGTTRSLVASGQIDLTKGTVPLPALGVVYQDVDLHSVLEGDRLLIRNARLTSQKGELQAKGELRLASITRVEPHVHLDARRFVFVDTPDLRAIASGSVDVSGTLSSPVVKGRAAVENSSLYLNPEELGASPSQAPVRLTEADRRMMEDAFGDVTSSPSNLALDLYDASDLDLKISLSRNTWVRQRARPKLSVAASGDFHLRKKPYADPELVGRIEPIPGRGYVEQFARSFEITGGEVLLNGPMDLHRVDIRAQYKPPSEQSESDPKTLISLQLVGPVNDMRIKLSSEPPMSEAEIVNYIATGRSSADWAHNSGEQTSSLAKDIGLSQVTGFAEEAAQEATGLDVLQVRFDAVEGATLVGGRYLDPKVYVGFRQPLQYKQESATTSGQEHRTSFEVEYAIYRWMVFNLQGEVSSVRSFLRFRHAY